MAEASVLTGERWIFVEDSAFLPAHGGGEREHLGMLEAARDAGILAAIVLPVSKGDSPGPYAQVFPGTPVVAVPRHLGAWRLLDPRYPYTVSSRSPQRSLVNRMRSVVPDATGIVVTSYKSWAIAKALADGLQLPVVLRMHNREGLYHHSLAQGSHGPRALALRWEARRIERDELRLQRASWVHGVADISRSDAEWRRSTGALNVAHVPPFAVRMDGLSAIERPERTDPVVVFVGALDVPTNTDAVAWLVERVWPVVVATAPQARLSVVGRAPSQKLRSMVLSAQGGEVHADVPDVQPYLRGARLAVNPAVSGSGVNIKLVDYLAAGIPVVSTSHALRGLDLVAGHDVLIADDPQDFALAIIDLLNDPDRANQVGRQGRIAIHALLDEQANLERVCALLHR